MQTIKGRARQIGMKERMRRERRNAKIEDAIGGIAMVLVLIPLLWTIGALLAVR